MTSDQEKQLRQFERTFEAIRADLERLDEVLRSMDRKLFGELGVGGEVTVIKQEIRSLYREIGKIQVQLKHFRDALTP